jgi:DNA-binding MarR family transcriptional regulator
MIPIRQTYCVAAALDAPAKDYRGCQRRELTDLHYSILGVLVEAKYPLAPMKIAAQLAVEVHTVSNRLRLLVNHGLIVRRADGTFKAIRKEIT